MPRENLYNKRIVYRIGGRPMLKRFAAKQLGGDSFADGRSYEIMFISRMILDMAVEWFADDFEWLDPFDLAEGLECLVDDLMVRKGENIAYFQIKSGRITDRLDLKYDFDNQQELDILHNFEASYYLVVTPRYASGIHKWLVDHGVTCELWIFEDVTGSLAMLPMDSSLEQTLAWLTRSHRRSVWVALVRNIVGVWMLRRDASIEQLFYKIADDTRYQSPAMLNDTIRLNAFYDLLEYLEIYPDSSENRGVTMRALLQEDEWLRVVPCSVEMLNAFDAWYEDRENVSRGDLMIWFERYSEESIV